MLNAETFNERTKTKYAELHLDTFPTKSKAKVVRLFPADNLSLTIKLHK